MPDPSLAAAPTVDELLELCQKDPAALHLEGLPLEELAALANRAHRESLGTVHSGLTHAVLAGLVLLEAKGRCRHGEWGDWLAAHFEGDPSTARRYMKVARNLRALGANQAGVPVLELSDGRDSASEPGEPGEPDAARAAAPPVPAAPTLSLRGALRLLGGSRAPERPTPADASPAPDEDEDDDEEDEAFARWDAGYEPSELFPPRDPNAKVFVAVRDAWRAITAAQDYGTDWPRGLDPELAEHVQQAAAAVDAALRCGAARLGLASPWESLRREPATEGARRAGGDA